MDDSARQRIEDRKFGREFAQSEIQGAYDSLDSPESRMAFALECRRFADATLGSASGSERYEWRMTDDEALVRDEQELRFGQHQGRTWEQVPADYLVWLLDSSRENVRYILSDRVQRRIEASEESRLDDGQ